MQTDIALCVAEYATATAKAAVDNQPTHDVVEVSTMSSTRHILLLEDDLDTQANLRDILELDGYQVDAAAALRHIAQRADWKRYQAVILDRRIVDGFAEDLLPQIRVLAPQAAVILVTGYPDLDSTISALRHGAVDYILKPVNVDCLRASLARIAALAEAKERAKQAERLAAVGQMIAAVSHEARNALQLTRANLDILAEEVAGQDEPMRLVNRVLDIQEGLATLFDDLRSSVAPLVIKPQQADLAATVRQVYSDVQAVAKKKRLELREHFAKGAETRCEFDAFRIGQVFRNLLDNSLAAGPDAVVVHVDYESDEAAERPMLRVTVRDNGPGLNDEQRQKIFEPFYTTKSKGTGLGMAIAKRIMEAHGGDICVGNGDHAGAEFVLALPRSMSAGCS